MLQAEKETELLEKFPYNNMAEKEWVPKERDKTKKVINLYYYFGVESLNTVQKTQSVAFRKSQDNRVDEYSVAAWLQRGENRRKEIKNIEAYDETKLKQTIPRLYDIIYNSYQDKDFFNKIVNELSRCGVILVAEKYLEKTFINGATRWFGDNPLIQISDRGKSEDKVWFTLFHEIGHILLHGKKQQFLNMEKNEENKFEREADDFASEILLSNDKYQDFLDQNYGKITKQAIFEYSNMNKILPSVLAGRLEHNGMIAYSLCPEFHRKMRVTAA